MPNTPTEGSLSEGVRSRRLVDGWPMMSKALALNILGTQIEENCSTYTIQIYKLAIYCPKLCAQQSLPMGSPIYCSLLSTSQLTKSIEVALPRPCGTTKTTSILLRDVLYCSERMVESSEASRIVVLNR